MITVMTTLYNAENYIKMCIDSMKIQNEDFHCYITDDMSTDNSVTIVENEIKNDLRFTLIKNTKKMYQPGNYFQISKLDIPDDSIVVTLDGDDWFSDRDVLTRVNSYYSDEKIKMSFGQFVSYDGNYFSRGFTQKPQSLFHIRQMPWTTSHLRTFKMDLFRLIREEDLIAPTGNYWEVTGDQAIIFPMIEMCSDDRIVFTEDINMVYNNSNPINDHKVNLDRQTNYSNILRSKYRYQKVFK